MFVLCEGNVARKPYIMPYTNQKIYSLEELCYYLYHNIYTLTEDFFQPALADWLREETNHEKLANKVNKMMSENPTLKDMVVTILCGCDYYRENEIREIIKVMDGIANLPVHKKKKMKADNYLRSGRYAKSLVEYRKLLHGSFSMNFTPEEYGDLLHNQGIAHFYVSSFAEAKRDFKDAFARSNKKSSLRHYLWLLLLEGKEDEFEQEIVTMGVDEAEAESVRMRFKEAVLSVDSVEYEVKDVSAYKKQLLQAYR